MQASKADYPGRVSKMADREDSADVAPVRRRRGKQDGE